MVMDYGNLNQDNDQPRNWSYLDGVAYAVAKADDELPPVCEAFEATALALGFEVQTAMLNEDAAYFVVTRRHETVGKWRSDVVLVLEMEAFVGEQVARKIATDYEAAISQL